MVVPALWWWRITAEKQNPPGKTRRIFCSIEPAQIVFETERRSLS
jgi:hypothetical protein